MAKFSVSRKMNRQMLSKTRGTTNPNRRGTRKIAYATKKRNPSNKLSAAIKKSLENMPRKGVIRKCATSFSMHSKNVPKEEQKSKLNPNLKKRRVSETSSEGGVEKSRARFSVKRALVRDGATVELPKVRERRMHLNNPMNAFRIDDQSVKTPGHSTSNSRKRRNLNESSSNLKDKRFRSSPPLIRKRLQTVRRPRTYKTLNSRIGSQDSVHTIYESNHFSKDSKTNIGSHQNQNTNDPSVTIITTSSTNPKANKPQEADFYSYLLHVYKNIVQNNSLKS